jgi:heptosyltransferase-2
MKVAVIKPDHVGDVVLASAAIRAVLAAYPDAAVFVAPGNFPLARFLFGEACDLRAVVLPHVSKQTEGQQPARIDSGAFAKPGPSGPGTCKSHSQRSAPRRAVNLRNPCLLRSSAVQGREDVNLTAFDLVLFLRHDDVLNPAWAEPRCRDYVFPILTNADHQSFLDHAVVSHLIGDYDIDAYHYGADLAAVRQKAARPPARIGLSIGSGFHANVWPAVRWIELGRRLLSEGRSVRVFCGPSELAVGRMIAEVIGLGNDGLVAGDARVAAFAQEAAMMDWFVASDGGTGHLCGRHAPVTSIFGPSPFRRYAPFGRWNRLLTRELDCAPCCQWSAKLVNGCLSNECIVNIDVDQVMAGIGPPYASDVEPGMVHVGDGCRMYYGVSHLGLADNIEEQLAA